MRIGQINTNREWGGGENQVLLLSRALMERGEAVTLFARGDGVLLPRARSMGVHCVELPSGRRAAARVIGQSGVELLHVHDSRGGRLGAYIGRRIGVPVVFSRRVASPVRSNFMSRRKYSRKSFQAVIAISNTVKEIFIQTSKYPADDVFVVPSGVDIGVLDAVERDKDFRKSLGGQYLAGGVGKLAPKKNWQFLVRVAAHLAGSGLDIQWVIAGDGNERDALLELACELGVDDRVHLLGFRDDSLRILKSLDVLFFPSVAEGASVTVRECMVLGTPVVAVDAAGTMESLAGHGWSVSDADIEGAAKSVVEALSNQELRNRYVAGARRYAVEHYTYDRTVSGTLEVYRKVLERN